MTDDKFMNYVFDLRDLTLAKRKTEELLQQLSVWNDVQSRLCSSGIGISENHEMIWQGKSTFLCQKLAQVDRLLIAARDRLGEAEDARTVYELLCRFHAVPLEPLNFSETSDRSGDADIEAFLQDTAYLKD